MPDIETNPEDRHTRAQITEGLRQLADVLDAFPEIPVPSGGWELNHFAAPSCDAEERAFVDRVAAVLDDFGGQRIDETGLGGHYRAQLRLGLITYQAIHIPASSREAFLDRWSNERNVITD